MYTAPEVFLHPYIYTTFLSTLPPLILLAIGLTFVIGAGEIDLCFPADHRLFSGFVFAVCSRNTSSAGSRSRRPRSPVSSSASSTASWSPGSACPPSSRRSATQFFWSGMATVLSGGKSYALRGAEQSSVWRFLVGRFGGAPIPRLAEQISVQAIWTALDRHRPLVHPEPSPLRRACALHRRFQCRVAGRRHRCRRGRRSSSSP